MRHTFFLLLILLGGMRLSGQNPIDTIGGVISYQTQLSTYVKFLSTRDIAIGDTLYVVEEGKWMPILVVKYISSTSCVGDPITNTPIDKGSRIIAKTKGPQTKPEEKTSETKPGILTPLVIPETAASDTIVDERTKTWKTEKIRGRILAASYATFSGHPQTDNNRMRYTLTFNARHIANTGWSAETYISFRHTLNEWEEVQHNFKKAFKVYSLALQYDINPGARVWLGRKINFSISNIGAIDGVQAEKNWKKFLTGAFVGTRPDQTNYGFNPDLFQFGAYVGHLLESKNGTIQSTLALAEQRNHNMTDRRFAYLQHVNSSIKNINIFTSFEFDLYTLENGQPKSTFDISSIYFSLRYRASSKLSVFGSYDARKNIIYYETYTQNFIDQLLEDEARQGFRFSFNYHPWKKITVGANAGYRFQKDNISPSKNLNTYLTISRIPGLQVSATLSAILIQSSYLDGIVYGIRASRDILKGKLYGEAEYRLVEYKYKSVEFPLRQSIAGLNLSWRITKKTSLGVNYEAEIQNSQTTHRVYTNIVERF